MNSLLARKNVSDLQREAGGDAHQHLKRALGPWQLAALGVGATIGAGIFVLTGEAAAHYAGPAIVLSFLLGAVACALAGLCYAEMAALIPIAGSAYTYAYATLGELVAWIIGWDLILEYALGVGTVSVGWSNYLSSLLADFHVHLPFALTHAPGVGGTLNVLAMLGVVLVAALLTTGVRESASVNAAIVAVKLAVIAVFLVVGVSHIHAANWRPFVPPNTGKFGDFGFSGILRGAGILFFAYVGFDAVSAAAQEAKNPQRDMPVGILGGLSLCTLLYVAVGATLTGVVSYKTLGVGDPIAVAVNAMGLHWLSVVVKVGIVLGLSSVMLVLLYGQTRIFYTMAHDGLLPGSLGALHPRFGTPARATWLLGGVIAVLAGLTPIRLLGEMVSIGTLFAFILVCAGVLYLRRAQPDLARPFKCPGVPAVPVLGILVCLYLISGLPLPTMLRLVIWLAIGLALYFAYGRHHTTLTSQAPPPQPVPTDETVWPPPPAPSS